jgi:hypothetical protein
VGPSLIFDKSFLQSLSVDEAAMLDQLYQCVITPIFFVETLADLGKPENARRPPEMVVGGLAERTPVCSAAMNEGHWSLIIDSLSGRPTPLDYRPLVPGGIPVRVEGKSGIVFEKAPETEAFERWQNGRFKEVERFAATVWRKALKELNLPEIAKAFRALLRKEERPKSLEAAKALARRLIEAGGMNFRSFQLALNLFSVPDRSAALLVRNWKRTGRRSLQECAPYAAHCLEVTLFFYLAISNGLISDQRASNLIDMAYLFYLPFARVFVSTDNLHRRVVPLFLTEKQEFVWGPELKADLRKTDNHFAGLPEEERAKGLFLLAKEPPASAVLICGHWDRFLPGWRQRSAVPPPPKDSEMSKKFIAQSNALIAAAAARKAAPAPGDDIEHMIIQRSIPRQRGKWRMFSKDVEEAEDKAEGSPGAD